jgi:O-antigen/teichoic acid export membrane protein
MFSRIDSADGRRRRLLGVVQGAATSAGNRAIAVIVSFISVPLTVGYLGTERYGVWIALSSLLAWFQLSDFGLGYGLTNAVTTAAGQDKPEVVRRHVSNGVFVLSIIAGLMGLAVWGAWRFLDWDKLFKVGNPETRAEVGAAVATAVAIFLAQMPMAVTTKIYTAYQEGRLANYWGAFANILSLLALLTVTHTKGSLVWLVIAVSGTQLAVNVASTIWLFHAHRPELRPRGLSLNLTSMRAITHIGGQFFLIQIMALVTFSTDNLVISHFLGASYVPAYSVTYKLFAYAALPQTIVSSYLWAAYNEAIARRDIPWVERTFKLSLRVGLSFSIVATVALCFIAKPFIALWAGRDLVPSSALILWMAAWTVIVAFTNPLACLLAAASRLRYQIAYSSMATVSNLLLSIYLVQRWGVVGVIAATVISYSLFVCAQAYIDTKLLLTRLRASPGVDLLENEDRSLAQPA